ncbi:hypothetical protein AB4228_07570 [Vibrio breoganii]|uniref:hypothetical protein n=1 Tax=Vibrio breoganii TaxID=553239 RepID=UPI0010BDDB7D|nr:hypothetical protein [Vibrio breoganii]TKG21941.1 hypothetical protein FCV81_08465 [Vibrio breoganii]
MTQAAPDKITFMGDTFSLCPVLSVKGEREILTRDLLGIKNTSFLSGCSRGFTGNYVIGSDNRLRLCSISLVGSGSISQNICGKEVICGKNDKKIKGIEYFPLFTGTLVLWKDYLKKSSFIYSCSEDYETVIELELTRGKVIHITVTRAKETRKNNMLSKEFETFTEAKKFAKFLSKEGVKGVVVTPSHLFKFTVQADFDKEFENMFNDNNLKQRRCTACDELIPIERIEIAPNSYLCTGCLSKLECNSNYHRKIDVDGIGGSRADARRTLRNRRN